MDKINKIIIHCSATPENREVDIETIRGWHMNENGWSDIGYHFVVELDGTIQEGRPIDIQGAHTRGHNKNSIGICYVGGLDDHLNPKDTRNEAQKFSLEVLLFNLMDTFKGCKLYGHNEFSSKACPSFNVKKEYKELIEYYG